MLTSYRDQLLVREGRLAVHAILRDAVHEQQGETETGLPPRLNTEVGSLSVEHFATLIQLFDPNLCRVRDGLGRLPLHVAAGKGAPAEFLEMLMFPNALRVPDDTGALPIHNACKAAACINVVRYLVDSGGVETVRKQDDEGFLPLHLLFTEEANEPTLKVVQYLVEAHPLSISTRTLNGDSPITLAGASSARLDVINYLVRQNSEFVNPATR